MGAAAQEEIVEISVIEELKRAAEKFDADFSKFKTKMHRYPPAIRRGIDRGVNQPYTPSSVAIGPYFHKIDHLQRAEEVKGTAAYYFCKGLDHSDEAAVYQKILSLADDTRSCYDDNAVMGYRKADFAAMFLRDGCFLLQVIMWKTTGGNVALSLERWFRSNETAILRDIFMMENQLPWLVLQALMDKTPAHLLGLLRCYQSGHGESRGVSVPERRESTSAPHRPSSAIELAEIGIKLVPSKTTQFKDMDIRKGLLFGELFLAPLVVDDLNASWLLNMVALEACSATAGKNEEYTVSSYLLLLAMLINREEDVHELRVKHILHGDLGDERTLRLLKNAADFICKTNQHSLLLEDLDAYKQKRWLRIAVHKFVYHNFKTIVTVFSIIGVLVGIFKTLLSLSSSTSSN
ncbi:hypothetical protein GQ55_6G242500 [Panicum hallii var. hallii]|uniref:DUF247 domain-containing protein n=1 Tax=Panicum hallii var. hallii TaxID=1504633 RepID=A0A2T7D922_9POAL|nr:hypothetical protein GQ55_6G242500 [Panicum hallii var. hallii]